MDFEPRGKVKVAVDAMRAEPQRIFTKDEVAKLLQVARSQVPMFLDAALRHKAIYCNGGTTDAAYAATPFTAKGAPPATPSAERPKFVPAQMVAPRPGSEQPRMQHVEVATPPPTVAPTPAPTHGPVVAAWPAPAPVPEPTEARLTTRAPNYLFDNQPETVEVVRQQVEDHLAEQEQRAEFNFCVWADGDIDLFGLQELEGGGHRLTAKQVDALKRRIAWMPPA